MGRGESPRLENINKSTVPPIGRGNRFCPYKVCKVKYDDMGKYKRQRSLVNPARAIEDMLSGEEESTTHGSRMSEDTRSKKSPKIERKEVQKEIEDMEVDSAGKVAEENYRIRDNIIETIEGRNRVEREAQDRTTQEKKDEPKEIRVITDDARQARISSIIDNNYVVRNGKLINASAVKDRTASIINETTQNRFTKDHRGIINSIVK